MRYLADPGSDLRAAAFLRSRFVRLSDAALARLGPRLAAAITDPQPPDGARRARRRGSARAAARARARSANGSRRSIACRRRT